MEAQRAVQRPLYEESDMVELLERQKKIWINPCRATASPAYRLWPSGLQRSRAAANAASSCSMGLCLASTCRLAVSERLLRSARFSLLVVVCVTPMPASKEEACQ